MQIKFLGTGGAFDVEYLNSAALIEFRGKNILIDCGFTVFPTLVSKGLISKVDYILLTHLHNDHCGSLANLLLYKNIIEKSEKPVLLYPSEQFKMQVRDFLDIQVKEAENYIEFLPLDQMDGLSCVDTYGMHSEGFQSYSYIFNDGHRIVYSGDLGKPEVLFEKLEKLPPMPTSIFHDITFNPDNTGHTYYKVLFPYLNSYDMFGYHCDPTKNPPNNPIRLVFNQLELMA